MTLSTVAHTPIYLYCHVTVAELGPIIYNYMTSMETSRTKWPAHVQMPIAGGASTSTKSS